MAQIADYIVIRDGVFDLDVGESRNFGSIPIPDDLVPGTARAKAILQYKVRPPTNPPFSGSTDLTVIVNGHTIETVRIRLDTVRGLWETFPATILNADLRTNFVQFQAAVGPARISDVILWFQRNI